MGIAREGVVSGDGHLEIPVESWLPFIPERYREFAPRLIPLAGGGEAYLAEGMPLVHNGTNLSAGRKLKFRNASYWEPDGSLAPGAGPASQRIAEQDKDGISAEVLYPPVFISRCIEGISDPGAYLAMVSAYNEFLADYCSFSPDRLIGVASLPMTGLEDAIAELKRVKKLGLRAVAPRQFPNGSGDPSPIDDAFWSATLEMNIKVTPHAALGGPTRRPAFVQMATGNPELTVALPGRASSHIPTLLAQMIVTGLFDRFPELEIYIAETNGAWLPHALYMLDDSYDLYQESYGLDYAMKPSEYVFRHFRFGIVRDPVVLKMLDFVPPTILIWGSDFPHSVGSWPDSREWLNTAFKEADVAEESRKLIARDNALAFFGVNSDASQPSNG